MTDNPAFKKLLDAAAAVSDPDMAKIADGLPVKRRNKVIARFRNLMLEFEVAARASYASLDPITVPERVFDPTAPEVQAWTVVLALVAQPRVPLGEIIPEYGAGVYALYYHGDHPSYAAISGKETPIYVGKADPGRGSTPDVRTQGISLSNRLLDHRRQVGYAVTHADAHGEEMVAKGLHPLRLEDFTCRKLVCAPGVQLTAEQRLIDLFRPIWNSDFNVAHGISKHGDKLRRHPKSPWDVLHPGRAWADGLMADGTPFQDQDTPATVDARLAAHLPTMRIFEKQEDVIQAILTAFGQTPATADAATAEKIAEEAEAAGLIEDDGPSS